MLLVVTLALGCCNTVEELHTAVDNCTNSTCAQYTIQSWNVSGLDRFYIAGVQGADGPFKNYNETLNLTKWGDQIGTASLKLMFKRYGKATVEGLDSWDTSMVTDMSYMFEKAQNFNQPLHFDTSSVLKMTGMFSFATNFNSSLNFTSTGNVNDMHKMFERAENFNQPLHFDTSSVTDMESMFYHAHSFEGNELACWDTSSLSRTADIFTYATSLKADLRGWPNDIFYPQNYEAGCRPGAGNAFCPYERECDDVLPAPPTSAPPAPSSESSDTALIAGLAAGGVVVLAVIVIALRRGPSEYKFSL